MKRTNQYCWRKDSCQKVGCKFLHPSGAPQWCWQRDACKKVDCKFSHPSHPNIQSNEVGSVSKTENECLMSSQSSPDVSKRPIDGGASSFQTERNSSRRERLESHDGREIKPAVLLEAEKCSITFKKSGKKSQSTSADSMRMQQKDNDSHSMAADIAAVHRRNDSINAPTHRVQTERKIDSAQNHRSSNGPSSSQTEASAAVSPKKSRKSSCGRSRPTDAQQKGPAQRRDETLAAKSEKVPEQVGCEGRESNSGMESHPTTTNQAGSDHSKKKRSKKKKFDNLQRNELQSKSKGSAPAQSTNARGSAAETRPATNLTRENRNPISNMNAPFYQPMTSIYPEWNDDESKAISQHRNIIESIKDEISQIILSAVYSASYDKHEANIRVLREKLIELESHVLIFDSVKSRACRELSHRPTELRNQIYREIYRFKCRLGSFAKRLDMEKYFAGGHRFLIVQGQTGSGKSTQIPQYVADHPRFYGRKIICTQPRKLAAISLSRRVAFEYSGGMVRNDLSSYIGYQVGGDRRDSKGCRIEFVTEGIMLERIMRGDTEPFRNVGCIIVDEAHERSVTCDLLLGSFKKPDPRWRGVLVIVTSATIDLSLFSEFFNGAPTVQIDGRTFPVEVIYQPVTDDLDLHVAVSRCALQIHLNCKSAPGDILCFLPGLDDLSNAKSTFEREARKVATKAAGLLEAKVFTLYGKQDPDKQAEVFEKLEASTKRKIIFATDIAETSITIDGVVYVVDSGVKKEIVFDSERNISSLKVNTISKSSAIQRAGRCGRTQPGVCYRLYSQDEFESMNINAAPEVLCKPISLAVLTLLELSVDPEHFEWISPPSKEAISNAERELTILGAVDAHRKPTELGKLIAKCQQDPKMMKIVYSGCVKGFGEAACSVASILSVSNMFFWNGNDSESKAKAIQLRKEFAMPEGDVVTMYRIFEEFHRTYNGRRTTRSGDSEEDATTVLRKPASVWCNDHSLNAKSMFMALTTRTELINQLKRTKIWSKSKNQNKIPTNLDVQELMCSGYFIQCARVFHSKNVNAPVEYFSIESAVAGRLDFRSSLNLLDVEAPPKWIVYDKIVRLPNTIFPIASVMDEKWLEATNFEFYKTCLKKTEDLPTDLIEISISQVSFRMIVGRNFSNVDALEKELDCLLTGDADTGIMHLYCAPNKLRRIKQQIGTKIEDALTEIKKQVVEEKYVGETRVLIGEGYQVHEVLFEKEFSTFYVRDVKKELDKAALKYCLTMNDERLASLDCTYHDGGTYTAVAKFSSKIDAKAAFRLLSADRAFTVTPSYGVSDGIRHGLNCRLKLMWPTARSKGVAHIFFNTADGANQFLDNVRYIYANAVVHVSGATERSQQRNAGLRSNVVQAPLNYLQLPRHQQGCRFRFNLAAIAGMPMPNKNQLIYKVTLTGLQLNVDKVELTTTLNVYDLKNVIVEYEDFIAPATGNGLTPDEKARKLEPLRRFMDANTKTSDFFKRNTGAAGICIFFESNSVAKQAYNYARATYDSKRTDPLLGPHRLEIEFTHTISIQIGLFKYLQSQIDALQKEARVKGITSSTEPIQDNTNRIVRFHTSKPSLLDWIQEQLDELVRPTKFNCAHSELLFKWTGRLELMKFAKKSYINWSDVSQIIWVYGSAEVKETSCKAIERIATHLHSLEVLDKEIWLNKSVRINGKEGRNITSKCNDAKIAFYHFHGNKMYISGSRKSVATVEEYLTSNKYSWDRSKGNRFKLDENRECGLCGMPPDNTFIMLSVCGHLFCSDCIEPMVNMQPPPFPIKCPMCDEYVALHDIKKLAPPKSLEKVLELAVKSFQQANKDSIRECPQPGCNQLLCYEQRTEGTHGGDFLFCDTCITTYCISCSEKMEKPVKSHEDDSCENIQNGVANLVFKHVRVIQETVFNLMCPSCNTAFYEFEGCAAVTCSTCKAGFCGLCLANCGTDAHSHVLSCSKNPRGSYYVNKAELDAVHLDMRNRKLKEYLHRHQFNSNVQQQIIEKIRKDLVDLKMRVPVVSANPCDEQTTETPTAVMRHVRKIQETILTLNCCNCSAAFFDFDGCACVTCYACQMEFCGLCLEFASRSVKEHVVECQRNPRQGNIFLNSNELRQIHAAVRADRMQSYFDEKITDSSAKEKVLTIIRRDLSDLQVKLPDVTVKQRARPARPPQPPPRAPVQQMFYNAPQPPPRVHVPPQPQQRDFFRQAEPVRRPAAPPRRECCIL